jgi:Flp pilus assembly protein TadG
MTAFGRIRPRDTRRRHGWRERGALGAMVAVLAPPLIALLGLVYDGGLALEGRQRALDAAEQGARAAGNQCDPAILRDNSDCQVTNQSKANTAAQAFMGDGVSMVGGVSITNGGHTVTVQTEVVVKTVFLGLFGVHEFRIQVAPRSATAVTGLA